MNIYVQVTQESKECQIAMLLNMYNKSTESNEVIFIKLK